MNGNDNTNDTRSQDMDNNYNLPENEYTDLEIGNDITGKVVEDRELNFVGADKVAEMIDEIAISHNIESVDYSGPLVFVTIS